MILANLRDLVGARGAIAAASLRIRRRLVFLMHAGGEIEHVLNYTVAVDIRGITPCLLAVPHVPRSAALIGGRDASLCMVRQ